MRRVRVQQLTRFIVISLAVLSVYYLFKSYNDEKYDAKIENIINNIETIVKITESPQHLVSTIYLTKNLFKF
jgi:hypothetical protein